MKRRYNRPTEEQKREIVEKYASGGYTHDSLAAEYGVSVSAIKNYLKMPEFAYIAEKVAKQKKEEAEKINLEFFPRLAAKIKAILPAMVDITPEQIAKLPIRDRIGAFKILGEFLLALKSTEEDGDDNRVEIVLEVRDLAKKERTDES